MITHGHSSSLYKSRRRSKRYPRVKTKAPKATSIKGKASDRTVSPQTGIYTSKYWVSSSVHKATAQAISEQRQMVALNKELCSEMAAARTAYKERKRHEAAKR